MIKRTATLSQAKAAITSMLLKDIDVVIELGRNKRMSFSGKLVGVYPALFTVSPSDKNFTGKTSYSYSEYLCGKVRIKERPAEA